MGQSKEKDKDLEIEDILERYSYDYRKSKKQKNTFVKVKDVIGAMKALNKLHEDKMRQEKIEIMSDAQRLWNERYKTPGEIMIEFAQFHMNAAWLELTHGIADMDMSVTDYNRIVNTIRKNLQTYSEKNIK